MMKVPVCYFFFCKEYLATELEASYKLGYRDVVEHALNDIYDSIDYEPIELDNDGTPLLLMAMSKQISKDCYLVGPTYLKELQGMTETHHDDYLEILKSDPNFNEENAHFLADITIANYNKAYEAIQKVFDKFNKLKMDNDENYAILMNVVYKNIPTQEDLI